MLSVWILLLEWNIHYLLVDSSQHRYGLDAAECRREERKQVEKNYKPWFYVKPKNVPDKDVAHSQEVQGE